MEDIDIPAILKSLDDAVENNKNIIGSGAFGKIYKIPYKEGFLAVKVPLVEVKYRYAEPVPQPKTTDRYKVVHVPDMKTQFLRREATVLSHMSKVSSPYILRFKYVLRKNPYTLATEFLEGYEELYQLIDRENLDWNCIFEAMIHGLIHVHANDAAHSDIHNSNIMVNVQTDSIRYIDFGLACQKTVPEFDHCIPGLSTNRAPETFDQDSLSVDEAQKADIWSLGITIYACICALPGSSLAQMMPVFMTRDVATKDEILEWHALAIDDRYISEIKRLYRIDMMKLLNLDPTKRDLEQSIVKSFILNVPAPVNVEQPAMASEMVPMSTAA